MNTDDLSIKHTFSDREIGDLARACSAAISEKAQQENDFKAVKTDYAARIAMKEATITSLSSRISSGFEMRIVRHIMMDHRIPGYRLLVNMETGHITRRRKLNPEEMQMQSGEPAPSYCARALLVVDDEGWDESECAVSLLDDEFAALLELPDVHFLSWPK